MPARSSSNSTGFSGVDELFQTREGAFRQAPEALGHGHVSR